MQTLTYKEVQQVSGGGLIQVMGFIGYISALSTASDFGYAMGIGIYDATH